jgi:hypothetical protein
MAYDKTKPVNDTLSDADVIRGNLNALATHHRGGTPPPDPEPGWIWYDDADIDNHKLRVYTELTGSSSSGASPYVWMTFMEHLESAPAVPGAGGSFTRGVLTGSFDQKGQYVIDHVNVSGFPNDAIVTGLTLWPSPIGGGQYSASTNYSQAVLVLPKDAAASADASNMVRRRTGPDNLGGGARPLSAVAAQGATEVTLDSSALV